MISRGKILIVDDDEAVCETFKDVLEMKGYEVCVAKDGHSALFEAKNDQFTVATMDIRMPGTNGLEILRMFKKIAPRTPVIMISANAIEDMVQEALREGAYTALAKPVTIDSLIESIEDAKLSCA